MNAINMCEIGASIRNNRKKNGITQDILAEKIGVTKSTISKYELGQREPGFEQLILIAKALNCTIFDFIPIQYHEYIMYGFEFGYDAREEEFHDMVEFAHEELSQRKSNPQYMKMLLAYNNLNDVGKQRAVEYTEALVLTGKYKPSTVQPLTIEGPDGFLMKIQELPNNQKEPPQD